MSPRTLLLLAILGIILLAHESSSKKLKLKKKVGLALKKGAAHKIKAAAVPILLTKKKLKAKTVLKKGKLIAKKVGLKKKDKKSATLPLIGLGGLAGLGGLGGLTGLAGLGDLSGGSELSGGIETLIGSPTEFIANFPLFSGSFGGGVEKKIQKNIRVPAYVPIPAPVIQYIHEVPVRYETFQTYQVPEHRYIVEKEIKYEAPVQVELPAPYPAPYPAPSPPTEIYGPPPVQELPYPEPAPPVSESPYPAPNPPVEIYGPPAEINQQESGSSSATQDTYGPPLEAFGRFGDHDEQFNARVETFSPLATSYGIPSEHRTQSFERTDVEQYAVVSKPREDYGAPDASSGTSSVVYHDSYGLPTNS